VEGKGKEEKGRGGKGRKKDKGDPQNLPHP